jgi:DNA-binding response OmpR family regulator
VSPYLPSWRVLIADACAGRRAFLRACLHALGHQPIESETGPTALRMLRGDDVDAALLHMHLPGMDGLHVLTEFRKHRNDVAILLMSSDSSIPEASSVFRNGGDSYLPLPLTKLTLADELRQAYVRREVIVANLFKQLLMLIDESAFAAATALVESDELFRGDACTGRCEPRGQVNHTGLRQSPRRYPESFGGS